MAVLSGLEPKEVFYYFEELTKIPHESGNTKAISDYVVSFAREKGLEYYQDENNNVILIKEASAGLETKEPVIIQGHLDMVCAKDADVTIDFAKDALPLTVEDGFVTCKGTTLGGDDGIAVAYGLALLADDSLKHPRLEAVFTVDEEIGLLGAEKIDVSMLKGRLMLNIDSDEDGIFLASCAGGMTAVCELPVNRIPAEGACMRLVVDGLQGGHSGGDIHKERGNAGKLMARALTEIKKTTKFHLAGFTGGLQDNAIPARAEAIIYVPEEAVKTVKKAISAVDKVIRKEYASSDANVCVRVTETDAELLRITSGSSETASDLPGTAPTAMLDTASGEKVLFFLRNMPNGIQHMSMDIAGLVETSLNAGIYRLQPEKFSVTFSIRSSSSTRKEEVKERLSSFMEFLGGQMQVSGSYPAWEFQKNSPLREKLFSVYEKLFGEKPELQAIHAGLECGIFTSKIPKLDCVSFGPENLDIHTPKERLNIASVEKYWKLLRSFLSEEY